MSLLAHHLCLRSKLRFSAPGWRLTPPRHDCRTAPQPTLYLPSHYITPSFFHPLLDGENMPSPELPNPFQLTTNNSSSNHPCRLIPPSLLNFQCPTKVQASVSSVIVSALAFLDVYQTASDKGKACLLDGSTQQGASAWHFRTPKSERFRYISSREPTDLSSCCKPSRLPSTSHKKTVYRALSNQASR